MEKKPLKKDIFVISSPFQMITAYEAINYLELNSYQVYVLFDLSEVNKIQLQKTIDILNIENVKYFFEKNDNKYFYIYEKIRLIVRLLLQRNRINSIFLGNFTARLYVSISKLFNLEKVYLLDDGVATLSIQDNFNQDNFHHLFTMFSISTYQGQKVIVHTFQGLKSLFKRNNVEKTDSVFILGGKLSEVNVISAEYYYEVLIKIKKIFPDKTLYYIPHRGEDCAKVSYIENNIGFVIKRIDYPVELIFLDGMLPTTIISFFSTALISLSEIYNHVDVCAVRLDYNELIERKKAIINLYDELENYIDVIDLAE